MTLEETIKHCEEVAEELDMKADFETDNQTYAMSEPERTELKECVKDHRQLAEWLKELKAVHDAQDVSGTNVGDAISRQAAIDALKRISFSHYFECGEYISEDTREIEIINSDKALEAIKALPPAQPEPQLIPFVLRPATDEEKEENPDLDYYLDGKLPKNGQKILITVRVSGHEEVQFDEFYSDFDGSYLDGQYEIGTEAVAWMPRPEPYKEGDE